MTSPIDLANEVAQRLSAIEGVVAVVLGGSAARGEADERSDLDLGIYYRPERPPSVAALRALAQELDDRHPPDAATDYGGWGPWINGGAWLEIRGKRVDWIYRDMAKVAHCMAECRAGRPTLHYQPGHPHGWHTHMYMGEVHHGRALFDPEGAFARLQAETTPYPPLLKAAHLRGSLWEAGFAIETCHKAVERGDVFYVSGCLFRSAACLVQVLFALNERYFLNEKRSVQTVATFRLKPERFTETVTEILSSLGTDAASLRHNVQRMSALVQATRALGEGQAP